MSLLDRLMAASMPLVPRPVVRRLSTRYIAGEQLSQALSLGAELQQSGYRVTYDILGEAVSNREGVQAAAVEYQELLAALVEQQLELNISLKPTQMGLDVSEDFCFETVASILEQAQQVGAFVRYEMEDSPTTDATLRVFDRLREAYPRQVGCVLQSMLHRTQADVERLLESELPLNVRMVKGIYVEPAKIAFQDPAEVNASYLRCTETLLDGGAFVAIATHDEKLIEGLQHILQTRPEARERVEVQMLLGVREELRQQVRAMELPVRVYIPYGTQWYPYVVRRLRKNPKLARYALQGLFRRREKLGQD